MLKQKMTSFLLTLLTLLMMVPSPVLRGDDFYYGAEAPDPCCNCGCACRADSNYPAILTYTTGIILVAGIIGLSIIGCSRHHCSSSSSYSSCSSSSSSCSCSCSSSSSSSSSWCSSSSSSSRSYYKEVSVRECFDVAGPVPVVGARTESKGLVFTPVIIQANGEEIVGEQMSLENSEQNIPLPENAEVAKVVLHIHRNEGGVSGTTQVRVLKHNQNEEATCFEMKFDANPSTEGCKEVFELACCN